MFSYPTAFSSWGKEEKAAIERVAKSGRWTAGPEVEAFEAEFAEWHGRKHGIMTNSGSSANMIAVAAATFGDYRHKLFAVPAIAWSTTYAPLFQQNKSMSVIDVDDTWNAPPPRATQFGGIMGCSILGNPGFLSEWRAVADASECIFIEDNCESLGAITKEGKLTGTYGDLSTFSFFYSHQISAIEGGMILTDDDDLADLCYLLCNHGNAGWGDEDFAKQYDFTVFGYNVRGLELHAAIARAQLKKLNNFIQLRLQNYYSFWRMVNNLHLPIKPPLTTHYSISPFGIAFEVLAGAEARSRLAAALRSAGIDCRPPTGGSFTKHVYGFPWRHQKTPVADRIHDTGMFIGNPPWHAPKLIEQAVKVIKDTL